MPLDTETQALVTAASCDVCAIPQGMIYYAVLAALIDVSNGDSVPTDSATLMAQAACLEGCIPSGYLPYVLLQAVRGISSSGVLTPGSVGTSDPEGSVTANPGATYYNSSNQTFWVKGSGVGTNTGWVSLI